MEIVTDPGADTLHPCIFNDDVRARRLPNLVMAPRVIMTPVEYFRGTKSRRELAGIGVVTEGGRFRPLV